MLCSCWPVGPGTPQLGTFPGLSASYLEVPLPGTSLEDWTSTVGVMEPGGAVGVAWFQAKSSST